MFLCLSHQPIFEEELFGIQGTLGVFKNGYFFTFFNGKLHLAKNEGASLPEDYSLIENLAASE